MTREPRRDDVVTLTDGRGLAFAEWGEPDGPPLLFFHGSGTCRLIDPGVTSPPARPVRLVTVDRPGYGRSDPLPGARLLDWPPDVVELARALAIDRFAVVGYSAGGAYALACARAIPERLTAVGVVASPAPPELVTDGPDEQLANGYIDESDHAFLTTYPEDPDGAIAAYIEAIRPSCEDPTFMLRGPLPEIDARLLDHEPTRQMWERALVEGARQGPEALVWPYAAMLLPWGFELGEIRIPVHLWHGDSDGFVPMADSQVLAASLPNASLTPWRGEGHTGCLTRWPEIVSALLAC